MLKRKISTNSLEKDMTGIVPQFNRKLLAENTHKKN